MSKLYDVMKHKNTIPCWCADGVQNAMYEHLTQLISTPVKILELGAGTGRLSSQLARAGHDVTAADWHAETFQPSDITCHKVNCDNSQEIRSNWAENSFDIILCGDLIEHLKYPWQFVEDCHYLLKPQGHLLLSTPYITSASSRINMLIEGNVNSFGPKSAEIGHISPLFPAQIINMLQKAGFDAIEHKGIGTKSYLREISLRGFAQMVFTIALRLFMRKTSFHPVLLISGCKTQLTLNTNLPLGIGTTDVYASPYLQ